MAMRSAEPGARTARLARSLPENDRRQDYLRARLQPAPDGVLEADPFEKQDSAMLSLLVGADCLVVRPPFAPAAAKGEQVTVIPLD
jgi:molybdopterin molybdotransferase